MQKPYRMIASLNDVRNPIDRTLRSVGFRAKTTRLWDRQVERVLQVVHLDKSSYGPQNRLEVFFSLNEFVDSSKYKLGDFDVKLNFDRIVEGAVDFRSVLDQEKTGIASDIRAQIIQIALNQYL